MLVFRDRKLQQVRGSYLLPLPPEWIRSNSMRKSDLIRIEMLNDGSIKLSPVPVTRQDENGTGLPNTA